MIMLNLKFIIDDMCFLLIFILLTHRCPLEWGKWFWNKERSTCTNRNTAMTIFRIHTIVIHGDLFSKMSDSFNIFLCFCWESHHEIKFYFTPSSFKCFHCPMKNHFFCKPFINDITHSLCSGFRSKSKASLSYILHFAHNIQRKCIDSKRWQCDINIFCTIIIN